MVPLIGKVVVVSIYLAGTINFAVGANTTNSYSLYDNLFSSYNSKLRPVDNTSTTLDVRVVFRLISINDLDEKNQILVSHGFVKLEWQDFFLQWNPENYNDLRDIVVPQNQVWRPDLLVGNSVTGPVMLGFDKMPLRVFSSGFINWSPNFLFTTTCSINIRYYPFDTQVCTIVLMTMIYNTRELGLKLTSDHDILKLYSPNGQWEILDTQIAEVNASDHTSAKLDVTLTLKRRRPFHVVNMVLPVILLSFLGNLVFALPADAGEKMSLSITILLAYVVFLTIVSGNMPQTSLEISLLAMYLIILVTLSCFSVIFSTLVLRIHHKDPDVPIPHIVARISTSIRREPEIRHHQNIVDDPSNSEDVHGEIPLTWHDVSKSVDRFFFWTFSVLTLFSTIVFVSLMVS